jgi:hypothetical protein
MSSNRRFSVLNNSKRHFNQLSRYSFWRAPINERSNSQLKVSGVASLVNRTPCSNALGSEIMGICSHPCWLHPDRLQPGGLVDGVSLATKRRRREIDGPHFLSENQLVNRTGIQTSREKAHATARKLGSAAF